MEAGDPIVCQGCQTRTGHRWPEAPAVSHCEKCPPWVCDQCGQIDSMAKPCACWTSLEGMAFADIKAVFTADGLGIMPPTKMT